MPLILGPDSRDLRGRRHPKSKQPRRGRSVTIPERNNSK